MMIASVTNFFLKIMRPTLIKRRKSIIASCSFTFTKQEHTKKGKRVKNEGEELRPTNKPRRKSAQHAPFVFPEIYDPVSRIDFGRLVPTAGAPAEGGR